MTVPGRTMRESIDNTEDSGEKAPHDPIHTRPRVSIGLPVYNGGEYAKSTIDSILTQTYDDFELIISDNASDDGTSEYCQQLADTDPRVRYYRNPKNLGANYNHNRVVALAEGEYFKWVGHDDLIEPTFIERCVEVLDADTDGRYVLCFTELDFIDEVGDPMPGGVQSPVFEDPTPHERLRSFWAAERMHQVQYGLIRRDLLVQTALEGDWYGSDRQLLIELALLGGFARVPEVLFHHREHRGRSAFVTDKSGWMSTARSGATEMGYWRRIGFVIEILNREYLDRTERWRVAREYCRYGLSRSAHWLPQLGRELIGSFVRLTSSIRSRLATTR